MIPAMTVTFIWTHPRSRSTALEKCLASLAPTMHEPFSGGYYLGAHPEAVEGAGADVLKPFHRVVEDIKEKQGESGGVVVKELAYCVWSVPQWNNTEIFSIPAAMSRSLGDLKNPSLHWSSKCCALMEIFRWVGCEMPWDTRTF